MSSAATARVAFDDKLSPGDLAWLQTLFEAQTGIALPSEKQPMVNGRLLSRVRALGLGSMAEYVARVRAEPEEQARVIDALTTHETSFFREPAHFELLKRHVARSYSVRVWSAACSTGEEPASIAMALAEVLSPHSFEVLGSDISAEAVRRAREGLFPIERATQIERPRLLRFCRRGTQEWEGTFRLAPELEARLRFENVNLLDPPDSLGLFDVVFLRNVLIYFDDLRRKQVVQRVLKHLKPGGLLLPGHAEQVRDCSSRLKQVAVASYQYEGGA